MATNLDIENYMIKMGLNYESLNDNMWVVEEPDWQGAKIVISLTEPIITFRVKLMELPDEKREEFMKTILELNATEMVSGAYGLEGNNVVIIETLQSENLDFNEFEAAIDSISFAVASHYPKLSKFRKHS